MAAGRFESMPSDLMARPVELEACISGAVRDGAVDEKPIAEISAMCAILLGYR